MIKYIAEKYIMFWNTFFTIFLQLVLEVSQLFKPKLYTNKVRIKFDLDWSVNKEYQWKTLIKFYRLSEIIWKRQSNKKILAKVLRKSTFVRAYEK